MNLLASPAMMRASVDEFLGARAPERRRTPRRSRSRRAAGLTNVAGLRAARTEAEDLAILMARKAGFPFFYPTLRTTAGAYQGRQSRVYRLRDEAGRLQRAYRLVVYDSTARAYYGIQGTTWRRPPILADPTSV